MVNKLFDLHEYISAHKIDICCIAETWASNKLSDSWLTPKGFSIYRHDRRGKIGGGVCCLVSNQLTTASVLLPSRFYDCEITAFDVYTASSRNSRFITVYIPPNLSSNLDSVSTYSKAIAALCNIGEPIVISGDFNMPGINWITSSCSNQAERSLTAELQLLGFHQCVSFPTKGSNYLDLVFCNSHSFVFNIEPFVTFSSSDNPPHIPVFFNVNIAPKKVTTTVRPNYFRADYQAIKLILENLFSTYGSDPSIQSISNEYNTIMLQCLSVIPSNSNKRKVTTAVDRAAKVKLSAWRSYRSNPSESTKASYKQSAHTYTQEVQIAESKYLNLICSSNDRNFFFRTASSKLKGPRSIPPLTRPDGSMATDDLMKANILCDFFSNVYVTDTTWDMPPLANADHDSQLYNIFSPSAIYKAVNMMSLRSSPGPNGRPPVFFINLADILSTKLSILFNKCLDNGKVPDSWNHSIVTPVYKGKGDPSNPSSYRPISLTDIEPKIMERCILAVLLPFLTVSGIIPKEQYGFVPGRASTMQLLHCLDEWSSCIDRGTPVDAIYVDFEKAFDKLKRSLLFPKLLSLGIPTRIVKLIGAIFSNRTHQVRVGSVLSAPSAVSSGIVQGSVLGPTLFLIFTSDLPAILRPIPSWLFADDVKFYAPTTSIASCYSLQTACDNLYKWSVSNCLPISRHKSVVMHLGHNNTNCFYTLGDRLTSVFSHADLGITISNDLTFSDHCATLAKKANYVSYLILKSFSKCDAKTQLLAFTTYARPILEYASPVWSPHMICDIETLERPQRNFTRSVCRVSGMSYEERLASLGLHSLEWRRLSADLKLCYRIIYGLSYSDPMTPILTIAAPSNTRRHPLCINLPVAKKNCRYHFYTCRVGRIWNSLPQEIVLSSTYYLFCKKLEQVNLAPFLNKYAF